MPKPQTDLPVITTIALPSSLPSHAIPTSHNACPANVASPAKPLHSSLTKRAQTPAVSTTSDPLFQKLCSFTPGSPDVKAFFNAMRKGNSEMSDYSEANALTLLYDVFRTLWGQHLGKCHKFYDL